MLFGPLQHRVAVLLVEKDQRPFTFGRHLVDELLHHQPRPFEHLRRKGVATEMAYRGNMKKRMQRAAASGAGFALIIGDDELAAEAAQVKDLKTGEQRAVAFELLEAAIRA